ncbi:hypothetical protein PFISCL1PPCAC_17037 [Pristionchus fissidentatus]|uniref:Major sperm protein n=1 Tax=Pristionchus fissidentatus TaxID=1538716 RepID=A0AAV5W5V4_9BILA|nr:hypothetical protein PFISCL1PPCAC_17037 [Pristionchus fissidentatus]
MADDMEQTGLDDRNDKTGNFSASKDKSVSGSQEGVVRWASKEKVGGGMKFVKPPPPLPNKPWEPQFKMQLSPPDFIKMRWLRGVCVYSELTITNHLPTPQCYKMKCTDNALFRVRPPMNFVDCGGSATVKILHTSFTLPDPTRHYFAIYHVKCTAEDVRSRNFKRIWKSSTQPDGVIRMPVCFETNDTKVTSSSKKAASTMLPPTGKAVSKSGSTETTDDKKKHSKNSSKKKKH